MPSFRCLVVGHPPAKSVDDGGYDYPLDKLRVIAQKLAGKPARLFHAEKAGDLGRVRHAWVGTNGALYTLLDVAGETFPVYVAKHGVRSGHLDGASLSAHMRMNLDTLEVMKDGDPIEMSLCTSRSAKRGPDCHLLWHDIDEQQPPAPAELSPEDQSVFLHALHSSVEQEKKTPGVLAKSSAIEDAFTYMAAANNKNSSSSSPPGKSEVEKLRAELDAATKKAVAAAAADTPTPKSAPPDTPTASVATTEDELARLKAELEQLKKLEKQQLDEEHKTKKQRVAAVMDACEEALADSAKRGAPAEGLEKLRKAIPAIRRACAEDARPEALQVLQPVIEFVHAASMTVKSGYSEAEKYREEALRANAEKQRLGSEAAKITAEISDIKTMLARRSELQAVTGLGSRLAATPSAAAAAAAAESVVTTTSQQSSSKPEYKRKFEEMIKDLPPTIVATDREVAPALTSPAPPNVADLPDSYARMRGVPVGRGLQETQPDLVAAWKAGFVAAPQKGLERIVPSQQAYSFLAGREFHGGHELPDQPNGNNIFNSKREPTAVAPGGAL